MNTRTQKYKQTQVQCQCETSNRVVFVHDHRSLDAYNYLLVNFVLPNAKSQKPCKFW